MKHMLQICCKNNNISKEFPIGSSLLDIYYGFNLNFPYQVVSAKVNNRSEGLNFRVYNNKDVEFLDIRDSSGMRTYVRSLCFILYKAVSELFPEGKLFVEHPVSKGYFCNLRIGISPSRLHALSRSEWGLSPQAWLAERRIGHVRKWLAESDLPIADLALRAGYADQSALTRAMQRLTGLTPAAYRRQTRLEQKNRSPEQDSRTRP